MVFLSEGKAMLYVCVTNTKTILDVGLRLQGSLSSWMNLTFIPRKLNGLGMYQQRNQDRGPKSFRSKMRLWPCGQEGKRGMAGLCHPRTSTWAMQAKAWEPMILNEHERTWGKVGFWGALQGRLPLTSLSPLRGRHETNSHHLPGSDEDEAFCPTPLRRV